MCIETALVAMGMEAATAASVASGISVASSVAGLGLSALGTMQQTDAANKQASYQAQVSANNAQTAENEAAYARETAERNAQAQKRKTLSVIGTQRAAEGASGAVVDSGSFMDVTLDTAERGTLDALALLEEGDLAAWRAENQAANYRAQSGLYSASKKSALMPVGGSLLSGAGEIGKNYYLMKGK